MKRMKGFEPSTFAMAIRETLADAASKPMFTGD
jgi:hypothetical protein